jgi:hypothetical protein
MINEKVSHRVILNMKMPHLERRKRSDGLEFHKIM